MTIQTQVSVQSEVYTFRPRDYDVFAGLDVDHHSIAATFPDHQRLMQSLRLPYSARQLLSYVRKHFPEQRQKHSTRDQLRRKLSPCRCLLLK